MITFSFILIPNWTLNEYKRDKYVWKDKLNPKYLRILNNVMFILWNDEIDDPENAISYERRNLVETTLSATCVQSSFNG